ncbi:MAG: c-type cytochrome [Gammaproteobacteria bacterium]|nr:c-type cytochrome [Gammaproteobacteria bacterium]
MSRDQQFFDMYSLVIGVLAAVALGLLILSMKMSERTQGIYTRDSAEYQTAVAERIRPVGQVYLPGEEQASSKPTIDTVALPEPVATALTGPQVYNSACIACHAAGVAGAPIVGVVDAWTPRISQGMETLVRHAVEGYNGAAGYMPAKGGRMDLSDDEVADAVAYMVEESQ